MMACTARPMQERRPNRILGRRSKCGKDDIPRRWGIVLWLAGRALRLPPAEGGTGDVVSNGRLFDEENAYNGLEGRSDTETVREGRW